MGAGKVSWGILPLSIPSRTLLPYARKLALVIDELVIDQTALPLNHCH
ncbi:hypothetical protein [Xenorhabdus mauleonii]|nr:hypothetical protein [Xenorhabdus mauleonii]